MSAPLILGTNSIKDVGFNVDNSLRFNRASSDSLKIIPSSTGNRRTFTWSLWLKRTNPGNQEATIWKREGSGSDTNGNGNADYLGMLYFNSDDTLTVARNAEGDRINVSVANRKFRDPSAWYHLVAAIDSTQSTGSDRVKCYINGEEQTLTFSTTPSQNREFDFNQSGEDHFIGTNGNSAIFLNGYLAEAVLIDGQQLDATSFGEFDEDTGIWKPKDLSDLTFGTNGFYLDFKDSSALGNDVSGNDNDFTVNNLTSIDQTTDTCTNNYATFNNLLGSNRQGSQLTFSEGNCKVQDSGGSIDPYIPSTIGVTKGKWYAELKLDAYTESGHGFGIAATDGDFSESTANLFCMLQYATKAGDNLPAIYKFGTQVENNLTDNDPGDIIGCAVDVDNGTVDFTVNGSAYGSQVTGLSSNFSGKTIFFIIRGEGGATRTFTSSVNFGNPSFSITSGNSDANGYGNFEYSVPSGYYALNSKNLAEYG